MTTLAVIGLSKFLQCIHYPWHLTAFLGVSVYQRTDSSLRWIAKIWFSPFPEMLPDQTGATWSWWALQNLGGNSSSHGIWPVLKDLIASLVFIFYKALQFIGNSCYVRSVPADMLADQSDYQSDYHQMCMIWGKQNNPCILLTV